MADLKKELKSFANYLGLTGLKVNVISESKVPVATLNGKKVTGLASVVSYLAKAAGRDDLIGGDIAADRACVSQWLEYRVTDIDRCHGDKDVTTVLKELNLYLAERTYFLSERMTAADLLVAYGLHLLIKRLTFQEKEKYLHLSRWFDNIQSQEGVLQNQTDIYFVKNFLYSGVQQ